MIRLNRNVALRTGLLTALAATAGVAAAARWLKARLPPRRPPASYRPSARSSMAVKR